MFDAPVRCDRAPQVRAFLLLLGALVLHPLAGALLSSGDLGAQGLVLVGKVSDDTGAPIEDAEVRIAGVSNSARTDARGWFRVEGVSSGLSYFGVRKLGFRPAADLVRLSQHDTIDVTLEPFRGALDTVRVQARADASWERDLRRYSQAVDAARLGDVITREDIAARGPIWTSDLLMSQLGFRVVGGGPTARVVGMRRQCTPMVFIDGMAVPGFNINDITPNAISLLVTYRSYTTAPPQLQTLTRGGDCGLIAIYTM